MGYSILIVDDQAQERLLLRSVVEAALKDVSIVEAENGKEALKKLRFQKFDLVITDLNMPQLDGKTLIREIKTLEAAQRPSSILVVSGISELDAPVKKIRDIYHIRKPIDGPAFMNCLRECLGIAQPKQTKSYKMDASFITPFIDATLEVLEKTCATGATKVKVFLREKDKASGDVSAIVAMNSTKYSGSMAVSFEKKCFFEVVSNMLGEPIDELTDEIQDAAGEICNQIFGVAKTKLNEIGHEIQPAVPTVIVGDNHQIKHLVNGPCLAVQFQTSQNLFTIEAIVSSKT